MLANIRSCNDVGHGSIISQSTIPDRKGFEIDLEVFVGKDLVCKVGYLEALMRLANDFSQSQE